MCEQLVSPLLLVEVKSETLFHTAKFDAKIPVYIKYILCAQKAIGYIFHRVVHGVVHVVVSGVGVSVFNFPFGECKLRTLMIVSILDLCQPTLKQ